MSKILIIMLVIILVFVAILVPIIMTVNKEKSKRKLELYILVDSIQLRLQKRYGACRFCIRNGKRWRNLFRKTQWQILIRIRYAIQQLLNCCIKCHYHLCKGVMNMNTVYHCGKNPHIICEEAMQGNLLELSCETCPHNVNKIKKKIRIELSEAEFNMFVDKLKWMRCVIRDSKHPELRKAADWLKSKIVEE